jgi:hypothetical protein
MSVIPIKYVYTSNFRKNMTESQEKPLATWLMENIVKGDGSEYLDFEENVSKAGNENSHLVRYKAINCKHVLLFAAYYNTCPMCNRII